MPRRDKTNNNDTKVDNGVFVYDKKTKSKNSFRLQYEKIFVRDMSFEIIGSEYV
jgi:hypothetical protein